MRRQCIRSTAKKAVHTDEKTAPVEGGPDTTNSDGDNRPGPAVEHGLHVEPAGQRKMDPSADDVDHYTRQSTALKVRRSMRYAAVIAVAADGTNRGGKSAARSTFGL